MLSIVGSLLALGGRQTDAEHAATGAYDSPPVCHLEQVDSKLPVRAACLKNLRM